MTTEAERMAQLIRLAVNANQRETRSIIWVNTDRFNPDEEDEPTFWVSEIGRYVSFDEMDYDPTVHEWYLSA